MPDLKNWFSHRSTQMHTDESILPSSRKIKFIAAGIPVLLVLYVLSIGPVSKLDDYGCISDRADRVLDDVYSPLALLNPVPGTRPLFNWYNFHVWHCDNNGRSHPLTLLIKVKWR
jgi:hypothetical protein